MSRTPLQQRLISIVEPVVQAAGYELVELRFVLEQGGWTLRVAVDLPLDEHTDPDEVPSDRVDLEDCENLSRELSAVLDVEDPIPQAFNLEVSSPGIDRPLRTEAHFRHFTGSEAKIQLVTPLHLPSGDRRNFKGVLQGVEDGAVVIACDGAEFRLPIDDIEHAKLVPDWDAVMKGKSGVGKPAARPVKPGHRPSQKTKPERSRPARDEAQRRAAGDPAIEPRSSEPLPPSSEHPPRSSEPLPPSSEHPPRSSEHPPRSSEHPPRSSEHPPLSSEHQAIGPEDPRDATRGGVNGPASPVQRGRERPLSTINKEQG